MEKVKKLKFREAKIWVTDNGYEVGFCNYVGSYDGDSTQGRKVAKTLEEVKSLLKSNLIDLIE